MVASCGDLDPGQVGARRQHNEAVDANDATPTPGPRPVAAKGRTLDGAVSGTVVRRVGDEALLLPVGRDKEARRGWPLRSVRAFTDRDTPVHTRPNVGAPCCT